MRALLAIAISLIIHGMIALAVIAYVEYSPKPEVLAQLDVSSVELSFSEEDKQDSAALPQLAEPAPMRAPEKVPFTQAPEIVQSKMLPPDISDPNPVAPIEERPKMVSPPSPSSPPVPAPKQASIDAPARSKRNIRPDYPRGARQRGEQGDVVLEISIGADGLVEKVTVANSSGFSELDNAAISAAKAARFVPAKSGAKSVASVARLKLTFKLK